jgi:hypothetical protein
MTRSGTYLCPVCHKEFVTIGAKNGHIDNKHPEAAEIYHRLDQGIRILHLPRVRKEIEPPRIYDEAS